MTEIYDVLYGNYTFKELFFPPETNDTVTDDTSEETNPQPDENVLFLQHLIFKKSQDHDLLEYNSISQQLNNITRRGQKTWFYGYDDPEDWWYDNNQKIEPLKKRMLIKTNLQYLIHTRYKVYAALDQRSAFRGDKRYKLGYLFNRVRRLKTEMRKVISIASLQNATSYWLRDLHSLMRMYEQVVRYDVDIKDTSAYIKEIYKINAKYDVYKASTNLNGR